MTEAMQWMLITAEPEIAEYAQNSGVHRIFVDMEVHGKAERQGHVNTHKAQHTYEDITAVRRALTSAELMVRLNPLHAQSDEEIERSIERGADRLMLPMFSSADQVRRFRAMVPARTPITYLAETPAALTRTETWIPELGSRDEVHFGLNDLSLGMGLDFLFEPLAGGLLEAAAGILTASEVPFGIGGIARPGAGELPAEWILGEHVRLGSTRAILSRAFHGSAASLRELQETLDLRAEVDALCRSVDGWRESTIEMLAENRQRVANRAFEIAKES